MKTIRTSAGSLLTGTEIADAITTYGLALARVRDLDVVDIPFVAADGSLRRTQFRIGWLIDIVVTDEERPMEELIDAATIFALLDKSRALAASRGQLQRHGRTDAGERTNWDEII